ncbi:hypothetical protein AX16_000708 [Volvariella volvacea WC 439]|nr:hypothetical protein AX16_000708 [Volvariella volvacea WC 439]
MPQVTPDIELMARRQHAAAFDDDPGFSDQTTPHIEEGSSKSGFVVNVVNASGVDPLSNAPTLIVDLSSDGREPEITKEQVRRGTIQFMTLCWCTFMIGWNDGTTGPLLPRIREEYNVGFTVVSFIFIFGCLGFVLGAFLNVHLTDRLGFGKVSSPSSLLPIVSYSIQSSAPPFPAYVLGFGLNGLGFAWQDAQANGFVASIKKNAETKMGLLHAAYGAGALSAPLVSTQFAQMEWWSFHYLISLGLSLSNAILLLVVFRLKSQDECLIEMGQTAREKGTSQHNPYRQILGLRTVHLLAFFVLVYVGVEVTLGGWIVTYIIEVRRGGASSGYITSGFFGGLMLGRILLLWINKKVGERRVFFIYAVLAIGLEFIVWFVPSLIGSAIAVSFVGLLLGPMYPLAMNHAGRVLPQWLLTGSVGWIAGFGHAGSAIIPFMTGAVSQKWGILSLQPLIIAMMALMTILWGLVPVNPRKPDLKD